MLNKCTGWRGGCNGLSASEAADRKVIGNEEDSLFISIVCGASVAYNDLNRECMHYLQSINAKCKPW